MDPSIREKTLIDHLQQEINDVKKEVAQKKEATSTPLGRIVSTVGGLVENVVKEKVSKCIKDLQAVEKTIVQDFAATEKMRGTAQSVSIHKNVMTQLKERSEAIHKLAQQLQEAVDGLSPEDKKELKQLTKECTSIIQETEKNIKASNKNITEDQAKLGEYHKSTGPVLGGDQKGASFEAIRKHREPQAELGWTDKQWDDKAIKKKAKELYPEELKKFKDANNQRAPNIVEVGELKHKANERAYAEVMTNNITSGMYNPNVIVAEMHKVLSVSDDIPNGIDTKEKALEKIMEEVNTFTRPAMVQQETGALLFPMITTDQNKMLKKDLQSTMEDYLNCYGQDKIEEAFIVCRDMARMGIYQTFYDMRMLTGSDHGILHAHHNCNESEKMQQMMDVLDVPLLGRMMVKIAHYYHDIGYSVGATAFSVKSDHPYIGAAFIEANEEYFKKYFPSVKPGGANEAILPAKFGAANVDPTSIVKKTILNHADIFLNSDPNDLEKMVKFLVTVSDACAVSMDHKSQAIWRDHPETVKELMRLSKFVQLFPKYGGFNNKLGDIRITSEPWKVFPLNVDTTGLREDQIRELMKKKENFKDPMDSQAFALYASVKNNIMSIFAKEKDKGLINQAEYAAFNEAITGFLSGVGAQMVIGQFGTILEGVSCTKRPDSGHSKEAPKYRPVIKMLKGAFFALIEAALSKDEAAKGTLKVGEEVGADKATMLGAINKVTVTTPAVVEAPGATIQISGLKSNPTAAHGSHKKIESDIEALSENWTDPNFYTALATIESTMERPFKDWNQVQLTETIAEFASIRPNDNELFQATTVLTNLITSTKEPTKEEIGYTLRQLRHALPSEAELEFIGLQP